VRESFIHNIDLIINMDDDIQLTQEISSLRPGAFIIHMTDEIDKCWFLQL